MPLLFNVYRATMKMAADVREEKAGTNWQWVPGHSLPPQDTKRAINRISNEQIWVSEVLFVDNTTLLRCANEIHKVRDMTTENLLRAEEKCHSDIEEKMMLGKTVEVRYLGCYCDRKVELKKRCYRLREASFVLRKRLKRSRLSKQEATSQSCTRLRGIHEALKQKQNQQIAKRNRQTLQINLGFHDKANFKRNAGDRNKLF